LDYHPVAVVGILVLKLERDRTKGETIHTKNTKTIQNTKYTIENTKVQNKKKQT
jgi:hypothetical protein